MVVCCRCLGRSYYSWKYDTVAVTTSQRQFHSDGETETCQKQFEPTIKGLRAAPKSCRQTCRSGRTLTKCQKNKTKKRSGRIGRIWQWCSLRALKSSVEMMNGTIAIARRLSDVSVCVLLCTSKKRMAEGFSGRMCVVLSPVSIFECYVARVQNVYVLLEMYTVVVIYLETMKFP